MKTFFLRGLLIAAAFAAYPASVAQNILDMFVGSYSAANNDGIKWYTFNQETGDVTFVSGMDGIVNPSYLTLSADRKYLYSVNETDSATARLYAYRVDYDAKRLHVINSTPTLGADPCHVWVDNGIAATANYSSGSITIFDVLGNGAVEHRRVINYTTPELQSHLHFIYPSPDGRFVFADDLGADKIYKFNKTAVNGRTELTPSDTAYFQLDEGFGPRHAVFHPNGRTLYVIGELSGLVAVCDYIATNGTIIVKQIVRVDPLNVHGSADIHISPDGRFVYGSNRLKGDGITVFAVDAETGMLTNAGYQYTGAHPRNFAITPNGKYLLCACRDENCIQIFARDAETGLLHDTGKKITTPRPVCISF